VVKLGHVARHGLVAVLWVAAFSLLSEHAVRLVPMSLAKSLSLQGYLTGVQLLTLVIGLGLSFAIVPSARTALGLATLPLRTSALLVLAAPALYVVVSYVAIWVALPTLLAELAARGRAAVQEQSGEFGRQLASSGLGLAVIWGIVVSPLAEELMFRGSVWSAAQSVVDFARERLAAPAPPPASGALPEGVLEQSALLSAARAAAGFFLTGGVATLVSATVFASMHADMPGGLGMVRWVSALGLGLATGVARHLGGSILAPLFVHMVFNACALATTRRWLVTESLGQKLGVPILLSLIAAGCALSALALGLALRVRRGPSSG